MKTKRAPSEKQKALWAQRRESGYFATIGKPGGETNKARRLAEDPEYYSNLGTKGGNTLLAQRGPKYYSKIGKIARKNSKGGDA